MGHLYCPCSTVWINLAPRGPASVPQLQRDNDGHQRERDHIGRDQRPIHQGEAVDEPERDPVKVRVPASEIARVSRERMILIAWGSQHTVVSTAPVIPMASTSKLEPK